MDPLLRRSLGEAIEIEWVRGAGLWHTLVDPGQLENALLNAWITSDGSEIGPDDFDLPDMTAQPKEEPAPPPLPDLPRTNNLAAYREAEKARILRALEQANWNRVKASELLGMPRRTLYRRLKEYGIQ